MEYVVYLIVGASLVYWWHVRTAKQKDVFLATECPECLSVHLPYEWECIEQAHGSEIKWRTECANCHVITSWVEFRGVQYPLSSNERQKW